MFRTFQKNGRRVSEIVRTDKEVIKSTNIIDTTPLVPSSLSLSESLSLKKSFNIFIPQKYIDSVNLLLNKEISNSLHSKNIKDYLIYLMYRIHYQSNKFKYKNLTHVPLYSLILLYEVGRKYRQYIDLLINDGLIHCDEKYYVGSNYANTGKCKCYRINNKTNEDIVEYSLTAPFLVKKLHQVQEMHLGTNSDDEVINSMYEMMGKFNINEQEAKEVIEKAVKNGKITAEQGECELKKVISFNNSDAFNKGNYVVRDSYGRIHTPLTNIKSEIRQECLYIGTEKVVEIDIVASQPSMLGVLFEDFVNYYYTNVDNFNVNRMTVSKRDARYKYVNDVTKFNATEDTKPYYESVGVDFNTVNLHDIDINKLIAEIDRYKIALKNDIYEAFIEFTYDNYTRKQIKKNLIMYLFGSYKSGMFNSKSLKAIDEVFKTKFPVMRQLLISFKSITHKDVACTLQRIESGLMYSGLMPKLLEQDITHTTVHDCILVKKSDVDIAYDLFENTISEWGIASSVKVD